MKKFSLILLTGVLYASLTTLLFAEPFLDAFAQERIKEQVLVSTPVLNVRDAPRGHKVGKVRLGQQFEILKERNGWGKITYRLNRQGWISLDYTKALPNLDYEQDIKGFCNRINDEFMRLKWKDINCRAEDWESEFYSAEGNPLLYTVMGDQETTSLLLCNVHSDENALYQCFRLQKMLREAPLLLGQRLVIVPLVNPDSFLKKRKLRQNSNGVDLNRNLPTSDWSALAHRQWRRRYKSNKRRYPGKYANSEPENNFLIALINRYKPDKIISIHAPMNFLDMDYMDSAASKDENIQKVNLKAWALALKFTEESNTSFRNYRTYPGSLGRYGDEWKIPIFTLELPSSAPAHVFRDFKRFQYSLIYSFNVILDKNVPLVGQSDSVL